MLFFSSCDQDAPVVEEVNEVEDVRNTDFAPCDSPFRNIGKIYEKDKSTFLWAGDNPDWHFDISDWELNECNLLYGLGRETFPALMAPEYVDIQEIANLYEGGEQCVVIHTPEFTKVYPYELMISHEVVNEVIEGEPIMIAYCVLADLSAVYTRNYCGNVLTFGVTGYTYYEPEIWGGLDAFILWDRDTESLWWPLIDKAISGPLHDTRLEKYNEGNWEVLRWRDIQKLYPDALVLKPGQTQEPPEKWSQLTPDKIDCN